MKQIASNYTYNKTSGVISLTGVNIDRDQLLLIVNTRRNVTYYNFADSTTTLQAFTQGANTSVTLASSVVSASSTHTNADALTIYYDDQVSSETVTASVVGFNPTPLETNGTGVIQLIADAEQDTIRSSLWIAEGSGDNGSASGGQPLSHNYPMPSVLKYLNDESVAQPLADIQGTLQARAMGTAIVDDESTNRQIKVSADGVVQVNQADLGAKADAVATTDTGTFSVIAFIKRGLQNWTSLLAKIPALVSGRIPVDGSGVTQPVSLASLPALVAGSAQIGSVSIALSTTPAVTTFTSITSATLIASNTSRKMLTIQNVGAGILYVLLGSGTASSTNFSLQMNSGDYYENGFYNGQVNAIFASSGTAYVTSLT